MQSTFPASSFQNKNLVPISSQNNPSPKVPISFSNASLGSTAFSTNNTHSSNVSMSSSNPIQLTQPATTVSTSATPKKRLFQKDCKFEMVEILMAIFF